MKPHTFAATETYPQKCNSDQYGDYKDVLVSVIIPVYNGEKYLEHTLESICGQTLRNLEIICVDDGSTDDSPAILEKYKNRDSRVKIVRQRNQFAGAARNCGLKKAKGKYVSFLDVDDIFEPSLLEKMVSRAEITRADIVICGSDGFNSYTGEEYSLCGASLGVELLPEKEVFSAGDLKDRLFRLTAGQAWDKLFRRSFVKENQLCFLSTRITEDAYFTYSAFALAERITTVEEKLIHYRTYNSASLVKSCADNWKDLFTMLFSLKSILRERRVYELLEKSYVKMAVEHIGSFVCEFKDFTSFKEFCEYCRKNYLPELQISKFTEDEFENKLAYSIVCNMEQEDYGDMLCRILCEVSAEKDRLLRRRQRIIEVRENEIRAQMEYILQRDKMKHWCFERDFLEKKPNVAVYGYGDIGHDYCRQLKNDKAGNLVAVVDRDYKKLSNEEISVRPVEALLNMKYDYVLIAIYRRETADEIRKDLIRMGVEKDKILWLDPTTQD